MQIRNPGKTFYKELANQVHANREIGTGVLGKQPLLASMDSQILNCVYQQGETAGASFCSPLWH